jgi:hypothetical protein
MPVESQDATHYAAIVLKMAVPIGVSKNDIRRTLVGGLKKTAEVGLNA